MTGHRTCDPVAAQSVPAPAGEERRGAGVTSRRRSAGTYHEAMTLCPEARRFEFEYPVALAQPGHGEVLVDFPSAGAYIKPYLAAAAPSAVYHAVEHVPDYEASGLDVSAGTWQRLHFEDGSVDIVLCLAALHHVYPGRGVFYQECARILGEGGRLVIGDVAEGTIAARFLSEFVHQHSPEGHVAQFLRRDIDGPEIEASGFRLTHWENRDFHWSFPDRQTAIDFCRGLFRLAAVTDRQVWEGLEHFLGVGEDETGVKLPWQLVFIRADRLDNM